MIRRITGFWAHYLRPFLFAFLGDFGSLYNVPSCHCEPVLTLAWQSVPLAPFLKLPALGNTDSHTSDVGHWFGMTRRVILCVQQILPLPRPANIPWRY